MSPNDPLASEAVTCFPTEKAHLPQREALKAAARMLGAEKLWSCTGLASRGPSRLSVAFVCDARFFTVRSVVQRVISSSPKPYELGVVILILQTEKLKLRQATS